MYGFSRGVRRSYVRSACVHACVCLVSHFYPPPPSPPPLVQTHQINQYHYPPLPGNSDKWSGEGVEGGGLGREWREVEGGGLEKEWREVKGGGSGWRRTGEEVDGEREEEEGCGSGWRQVSRRGRRLAIPPDFHGKSNTHIRTPRIPILWTEQSAVIGRTDDISFALPPANTRYQIKFSVSEKLSAEGNFFMFVLCEWRDVVFACDSFRQWCVVCLMSCSVTFTRLWRGWLDIHYLCVFHVISVFFSLFSLFMLMRTMFLSYNFQCLIYRERFDEQRQRKC